RIPVRSMASRQSSGSPPRSTPPSL
ncbi:MAG: hypothetical protein AVDCRST_MAG26-1235, partial [uncultured Chloroflexia bacterium]